MSGRHAQQLNRGVRRRFLAAAVLFSCAVLVAGARFVLIADADTAKTTVQLAERNDSGVSATVELEGVAGATWFTTTVDGPDGDYLPILHSGKCSRFKSDVAVPLALVGAGETNATAIDIPLEELTGGGYVIDLHLAESTYESLLDPDTSVACGPIEVSEPPIETEVTETPEETEVSESSEEITPEPTAQPNESLTETPDESVMTVSGVDQIQPPDAGVGPIQSDRDWMMVVAAVLGVASFLLALTGIREQHSTHRGPSPEQFGLAQRVHRVRGLSQ